MYVITFNSQFKIALVRRKCSPFARLLFNPLSLNSDQHQFSRNNIQMLPREMIMRVNEMITKEKML